MDQTKKEEFWNTLTHFIGIVLSLVGFPLLIMSNNDLSSFSLVSILFFEFGLLFVYISSTLYHYVDNITLKKKLLITTLFVCLLISDKSSIDIQNDIKTSL